jgi:hypothetical protein
VHRNFRLSDQWRPASVEMFNTFNRANRRSRPSAATAGQISGTGPACIMQAAPLSF